MFYLGDDYYVTLSGGVYVACNPAFTGMIEIFDLRA